MNRRYLLLLSLVAMALFLCVDIFEIVNIWKQKDDQLSLRYKAHSREAFNLLISKTRTNGFEKAMTILDYFSGLIEDEELPLCETTEDSLQLRKQAFYQAASIIKKNETLTSFIKGYINSTGNDTSFTSSVIIRRYDILNSGEPLAVVSEKPATKKAAMVLVHSLKEVRNNFIIEFDYYIDLKSKNRLILSETILSLSLMTISIIVVLFVFWLTWKNLMEEKRLSELKSDFINNMTHELKTPLSTITVAGRTLEKEQVRKDEDRVLETARMIGKQSIHLNQLINTILDVSLLERTEFEMDKKEQPVDEILCDIVDSFLTSCNHCAIINEKYNCREIKAEIDLLHFTTMINNLLTNAVKYCHKEPEIDITTEPGDRKLIITISDNGPGIDKEHLSHIFEKFYRIPTGDIHKTKGLGLGLYYVKRIANAHGGEVNVFSKTGKGTTFVIEIPVK